MKSFSVKRVLSPFLVAVAVGSILNCGGGKEESFTTADDARVVSSVTGVWMGTSPAGNTYTLTLCEDTSDRETDLSCQTLHKVQGGNRGRTETTQEPTGCGGCDYDYSVYVSGTLEGDDLQSSQIQGQFALAGGDEGGKNAFPYQVHLVHENADSSYAPIFIEGAMKQAGVFDTERMAYPKVETDSGDVSEAGPSPSDSDAGSSLGSGDGAGTTFHRIGDATCPTP